MKNLKVWITWPSQKEISQALKSLPRALWFLLVLSIAILIVSTIYGTSLLNENYLVEVPTSGGSLAEGVIGSPRFVNPILATTDPDRDLTMLIYSGLMRLKNDGYYEPDLARSYEVSTDGLTYTFTLKNNLRFHDGHTLTTNDVEYTISSLQNPSLKSPLGSIWQDVVIKKISDTKISFTLKAPYHDFIANTTLGILPQHIFGEIRDEAFPFSDYNLKPIGSGPYQIKEIKLRDDGSKLPESYTLSAFPGFTLGKANITEIVVKFFGSESDLVSAYNDKQITNFGGFSPATGANLKSVGVNPSATPLPRIFGIYFNQNQMPTFAKKDVRLALQNAINKEEIISEIFHGFAKPANDPFLLDLKLPTSTSSPEALLKRAGFIAGSSTLSFTLSASAVPELKQVAEKIISDWRAVGVDAKLETYEVGDLKPNVIWPRKYDALFFGQMLGINVDPYSFWHSSLRLDQGSNIALYTNVTVDKKLEALRKITLPSARREALTEISEIILGETPAIFLYQPMYLYVAGERSKNSELPPINHPAERFAQVHKWHTATERVWPFINLIKEKINL